MLQELLPLRLKVTGHVFLSAVNLSEHLITGRTAAEWKRLSPSLSFFSSPPVTAATSSEPRRSAGQLSEVVICVFIWRPAELARLQSGDKLDPRPAKASSETKSIDPVTVRGRLSRHLGRNYSRGLALSRSLSLSLHSGKADRKRELSVGRVGRGPVLRMSGGGLFYSRWTNREIWEGCTWFLFALVSPPSSTSQRCASFFLYVESSSSPFRLHFLFSHVQFCLF